MDACAVATDVNAHAANGTTPEDRRTRLEHDAEGHAPPFSTRSTHVGNSMGIAPDILAWGAAEGAVTGWELGDEDSPIGMGTTSIDNPASRLNVGLDSGYTVGKLTHALHPT